MSTHKPRQVGKSTEITMVGTAVMPLPPAVPKKPETATERRHRLQGEAETRRLLHQISENLRETNLRRAVKLVHMAYRREGPLVEFFEDLGHEWKALADQEQMPPLLERRAG